MNTYIHKRTMLPFEAVCVHNQLDHFASLPAKYVTWYLLTASLHIAQPTRAC